MPVQGHDEQLLVDPAGDTIHKDLAWAYDFPTRQLLPIAGMIALYNEKVDIFLNGQLLERPQTHFFPSDDSQAPLKKDLT